MAESADLPLGPLRPTTIPGIRAKESNPMSFPRSFSGPAIFAALLLLLVPASDPARAAAGGEGSVAQPGITVTGIGLARLGPGAAVGGEARKRATNIAHSTAVRRAIGDGRRRAKAIARVLGVDLGRTTAVESQRGDQVHRIKGCSVRGRPNRPRCLTLAAVTVTVEIVGGGDGSASDTVGAIGTASVEVEPANAERNRSIKRAVISARQTATSEAAAAARHNAQTLAGAAGLTLGSIVSVSESAPAGLLAVLDPSFHDASIGTFGPGQFCGYIRNSVVRRDPATGRPYVVRVVRKRKCRAPREYDASLEVRYEAG